MEHAALTIPGQAFAERREAPARDVGALEAELQGLERQLPERPASRREELAKNEWTTTQLEEFRQRARTVLQNIIVNYGFGITNFGSISNFVPNP